MIVKGSIFMRARTAATICRWLAVPLVVVAASLPGLAAGQLPSKLDDIAKKFQINIVTSNPAFPTAMTSGKIDGQAADEKSLQEYAHLFAEEFSLYPADLIRRTKLKKVVLCRDLSFAGQRRNAIPDWEHDTLYLDVSRGNYSRPYMRKVIHHEFFHLIDYRDDGQIYRDDRWSALNPAGFTYGTGGRNAQNQRSTSVLTAEKPGFVNHYSTTGVEEDKAELFANLIVDHAYVESRVGKDVVLRAKVERIKEQLAEFCPEMNETFWKAVRSKRRSD